MTPPVRAAVLPAPRRPHPAEAAPTGPAGDAVAAVCPVSAVPAPAAPAAPAPADLAEAEDFVRQYHAEQGTAGVRRRLARVRAEIAATGTYRHTADELTFGARVAWRNSAACIGRLYWKSLKVVDAREVTDPAAVAAGCVRHLADATNGGRIRPVITVFAPDTPQRPGPRIHNDQLIRYAGYRLDGGGVLGDPQNTALTDEALALGWKPPHPRGRFDVLPLVVSGPGHRPAVTELPAAVVLEVPLHHPDLPALGELGLRWHAVPVISNMRLRVGGIDYPAAPFNGWYMGTEIGARNLADRDRYDLLPAVGRLFGLDMSGEHTLWRDRALVELNRAVLHSFTAAGITITDHHTESARFLTHLEREERAGRECPADWSWIVPPMSGALTPVFHRYYDTGTLLPNFLPPHGPPRCPFEPVRDAAPAPVPAPAPRRRPARRPRRTG